MNLDNLLSMDRAWLRYLMEHVGIAPTIAIPARLFRGEIPEGSPSLVELGLIEHVSDRTAITLAGRRAIEAPMSHLKCDVSSPLWRKMDRRAVSSVYP
jgi:hypothetical protein